MFSLLEIKINLLFNATIIRSLSLGNRRSFPRDGTFKNKPLVACKLSEEKKSYARHITEKSATRSTDAELLLRTLDGFPACLFQILAEKKLNKRNEDKRACNCEKKTKRTGLISSISFSIWAEIAIVNITNDQDSLCLSQITTLSIEMNIDIW